VLFRRVEIWDADKQESIVFLSNLLAFGATTIAAIYKDRWQVELFFKALKQTLKIKTFVGTSANAVRTQVWTALIAMLVLKYLQLKSTFSVVVVDPGGAAAAATVLLSRSVGVAGRSLSGPAGTGGRA
jgi:IS4 transposase